MVLIFARDALGHAKQCEHTYKSWRECVPFWASLRSDEADGWPLQRHKYFVSYLEYATRFHTQLSILSSCLSSSIKFPSPKAPHPQSQCRPLSFSPPSPPWQSPRQSTLSYTPLVPFPPRLYLKFSPLTLSTAQSRRSTKRTTTLPHNPHPLRSLRHRPDIDRVCVYGHRNQHRRLPWLFSRGHSPSWRSWTGELCLLSLGHGGNTFEVDEMERVLKSETGLIDDSCRSDHRRLRQSRWMRLRLRSMYVRLRLLSEVETVG